MSEVAPRLLSQRYVITEPLGEGGMAVVWHGYDRQQNIWCAVKILRERYAQQDRALRRFLDEGQVMLRLGHRNVIDAWDLVRTEEPFLVMEIAEGGSLKDWVDRHGSMPPRLAVDVAIQISKGIGAAHKIGVIHRDIKPHNILLNRRGQCKVTDFGIARILRPDGSTDVPDAATGTQNAMGTLGYMAPEQRTDPRSADVRTDVYGIGATMYTLLTGRVVTNLFIAEREPELLEGIPVVLVPILMRATGYKPDQRYETVQDLAKALFDVRPMLPEAPVDTPPLAPDLPPEAPPPPTPGPVESRAVQPSGAPALPPSLRTRTLSSPPAVSRMLTPPPAEFRSGLPAHVDGDDSIDLPEPRTRWWVVASSLSLLLVLFLVLDAFYVRTASSAAWQARAHLLHVAEREAAVIDKLARMGADRSSLERQFQQMATTSDPEQAVVAGETFASALRTAADEHVGSQKGKDWHDAMNAIASIEQAQDLLEARVEDWRRRAEGLGLPAVLVRIAPRPKAAPDST